MRSFVLFLLIVALASSIALCSEKEAKIGQNFDKEFCLHNTLTPDQAMQGRIDKIGDSLVAVASRRDLAYHFRVFEDDQFYAFSVTGGYIYVSTGLVKMCVSNDELAAVLAHEVAHCDLGHGTDMGKKIEQTRRKTKWLDMITNGWASTLANIKLLRSSRDYEREADTLALELVQKAGYSAIGVIGIFSYMVDEEAKNPEDQISFLKTHPNTRKRYDFFFSQVVKGIFESAEKKMPAPAKTKVVVSITGDRTSLMDDVVGKVSQWLVKEKMQEVSQSDSEKTPAYRLKVIVGEQPTGSLNISLFLESKGVESGFSMRTLEVGWVELSSPDFQKLAWDELTGLLDHAANRMRSDRDGSYLGVVARWQAGTGNDKGVSKVLWRSGVPAKGVVYDVLDSCTSVKKGAVVVRYDGSLDIVEGSVSAGDVLVKGYRNPPSQPRTEIRERAERPSLFFCISDSNIKD